MNKKNKIIIIPSRLGSQRFPNKPLYEINHAFYINSRNNYINMKEMLEQFIVDRNLNEVFANLNVISYS